MTHIRGVSAVSPQLYLASLASAPCCAAEMLLQMVGLAGKQDAYPPQQLSAGQLQRAVIARSLINDPEIVLADEPTSNLDAETEREMMALFAEIHATQGVTVLMVTHAPQLITNYTRLVEMADGTICVRGAA